MQAIAGLVGKARCAGCGRRGAPLCAACEDRLTPPSERPPPPGVSRILCPYRYEGAPRALVLDLKSRGRRDAASPLARALSREVHGKGLIADVMTWVPCDVAARRRRGFDHAELLARTAAERLGVPCRRLLERTGPSLDQVGLSAKERWANLEGTFAARAGEGPVCLVDDVITTGATAGCCAAALRKAGATRVELLVACSA